MITLKIPLRDLDTVEDHVEEFVCSEVTDSRNVIFNVIMLGGGWAVGQLSTQSKVRVTAFFHWP